MGERSSSGPSPALPVRLPPGRPKLATRPVRTGSFSVWNTIGIIVVAAFAAWAAGAEAATMRSGFVRATSTATARNDA